MSVVPPRRPRPTVLDADEASHAVEGEIAADAIEQDRVDAFDAVLLLEPADRPAVDYVGRIHRASPVEPDHEWPALEQGTDDRFDRGQREALLDEPSLLQDPDAGLYPGAAVDVRVLAHEHARLAIQLPSVSLAQLGFGKLNAAVGQPVRQRETDHGARLPWSSQSPSAYHQRSEWCTSRTSYEEPASGG